jgi:hypothetical protein
MHHTPRAQHAAVLEPAMRDVGLLLPATLAAVARVAVGAVGVGVSTDGLAEREMSVGERVRKPTRAHLADLPLPGSSL